MKPDILNALVAALKAAKLAGIAADPYDDGGTCNFDSPAIRIPRKSAAFFANVAAAAEVDLSPFTWFGERWFWVGGFLRGQAGRRTAMAIAATQSLRNAAVPGLEVSTYYRVD